MIGRRKKRMILFRYAALSALKKATVIVLLKKRLQSDYNPTLGPCRVTVGFRPLLLCFNLIDRENVRTKDSLVCYLFIQLVVQTEKQKIEKGHYASCINITDISNNPKST